MNVNRNLKNSKEILERTEKVHKYYNDQNYTLVIQEATSLIRLGTFNFQIYNYRGSSYLKLGNYQEARNDFNKVLQMSDYLPNVSNETARVYKERLGKEKEFATKKLAEIDKKETAERAAKEKEAKESIEKFRKAAEKGNAEAQYNLGSAYTALNDNTNAIEWYRKAMEQGYANAQYELGILYISGKNKNLKKEGKELIHKAAVQGFLKAKDFQAKKSKEKRNRIIGNIILAVIFGGIGCLIGLIPGNGAVVVLALFCLICCIILFCNIMGGIGVLLGIVAGVVIFIGLAALFDVVHLEQVIEFGISGCIIGIIYGVVIYITVRD
jgi:tetratricopeptide (TPR) repeat protein